MSWDSFGGPTPDAGLIGQVRLKIYAFGIEPLTKKHDGYLLLDATGPQGQLDRMTGPPWPAPQTFYDPFVIATDLTCDAVSVDLKRGKTRPYESFSGGVATIVFETTNNNFNPRDSSGPYGFANNQLFRRGCPIVVVMEGAGGTIPETSWWPLFSGFVDKTISEFSPVGMLRTHTVSCVDQFHHLARFDRNALDQTAGGNDTIIDRVRRWGLASGIIRQDPDLTGTTAEITTPIFGGGNRNQFPLSAERRYGLEYMFPNTGMLLQPTDMADNALTGLKAAVESTQNKMFVTAHGRIRVQSYAALSIPKFIVSDNPNATPTTISPLPIAHKQPVFSDQPNIELSEDQLIQSASFARAGGVSQVANVINVDPVGLSTLSRTDFLNNNDADVLTIAQQTVATYGQRVPLVTTVDMIPIISDGAMAMAMTGELLTDCRFEWSDRIGHDATLIGIQHSITPSSWMMTATLSEVP